MRSNGPDDCDSAVNTLDHSVLDIVERLHPRIQRWRRLRLRCCWSGVFAPNCSSIFEVPASPFWTYLARGARVQRLGQSLTLSEERWGSCVMMESMHLNDAYELEMSTRQNMYKGKQTWVHALTILSYIHMPQIAIGPPHHLPRKAFELIPTELQSGNRIPRSGRGINHEPLKISLQVHISDSTLDYFHLIVEYIVDILCIFTVVDSSQFLDEFKSASHFLRGQFGEVRRRIVKEANVSVSKVVVCINELVIIVVAAGEGDIAIPQNTSRKPRRRHVLRFDCGLEASLERCLSL